MLGPCDGTRILILCSASAPSRRRNPTRCPAARWPRRASAPPSSAPGIRCSSSTTGGGTSAPTGRPAPCWTSRPRRCHGTASTTSPRPGTATARPAVGDSWRSRAGWRVVPRARRRRRGAAGRVQRHRQRPPAAPVHAAAPAGGAGRRRLPMRPWTRFDPAGPLHEALTDREREVISLVAAAASTARSPRSCSSPETVKSHVANALTKLGAHAPRRSRSPSPPGSSPSRARRRRRPQAVTTAAAGGPGRRPATSTPAAERPAGRGPMPGIACTSEALTVPAKQRIDDREVAVSGST